MQCIYNILGQGISVLNLATSLFIFWNTELMKFVIQYKCNKLDVRNGTLVRQVNSKKSHRDTDYKHDVSKKCA